MARRMAPCSQPAVARSQVVAKPALPVWLPSLSEVCQSDVSRLHVRMAHGIEHRRGLHAVAQFCRSTREARAAEVEVGPSQLVSIVRVSGRPQVRQPHAQAGEQEGLGLLGHGLARGCLWVGLCGSSIVSRPRIATARPRPGIPARPSSRCRVSAICAHSIGPRKNSARPRPVSPAGLCLIGSRAIAIRLPAAGY